MTLFPPDNVVEGDSGSPKPYVRIRRKNPTDTGFSGFQDVVSSIQNDMGNGVQTSTFEGEPIFRNHQCRLFGRRFSGDGVLNRPEGPFS